MGSAKRINTGDYTITTFKYNGNPLGNVNLETHTLFVDGNLVVTGISANVQAFDTINPIFRINANKTISDPPTSGLSGIQNVRGSQPDSGIYYDEDGTFANQWIANNGSNVGPVLTSFNVKIEKTTSNPIGANNFVVITGNATGTGGTGLYVNAGNVSTELVSTVGVRKIAIIFG